MRMRLEDWDGRWDEDRDGDEDRAWDGDEDGDGDREVRYRWGQ